jgi:hypothetical protein
LLVIQAKISSTANFNVEELQAASGYDPYSLLEFNDVVANVYVSFVTGDDVTEKAIVYKTVGSRRNKWLGEYFEFEFNENEAPDPNPVVPAILQETERNGRSFPDMFWSEVCTINHVVLVGGNQFQVDIMIRAVLVGSLVLKAHPTILSQNVNRDGQQPQQKKVSITADFQRQLFGSWITPRHRLSVFFSDFDSFKHFVKNGGTNHWMFGAYPDYLGVKVPKKRKLTTIVDLCKAFELDRTGQEFSHDLTEEILNVIDGGNLGSILSMGLKAMNAEYVDYIVSIREQYRNTLNSLLRTGGQENDATRYKKVSKDLGAEYKSGVHVFR